jgi:hypothetical protein
MKEILLDSPAGRYRWHEHWVSVPEPGRPQTERNGRTHGIVIVRSGNIFIFHQSVPAMLVYDADGKLLNAWGEYPGAHGLTLVEEDGVEFLWLADEKRCVVEKTTLDGTVVQRLEPPAYAAGEPYIPTWVAVNETRHGGKGDIWVADGYGSSRVHRYDATGKYIASIDGSTGAGRFDCPHGIWFNTRKRPMELYIADRGNRRVQVYDGNGSYLRSFGEDHFSSPDCFYWNGEYLLVPELFGRVSLLDAEDQLVCHLGVNPSVRDEPPWPNDTELIPGLFSSPHGGAIDASGNIFIVEWRLGGRVLKLEKVS